MTEAARDAREPALDDDEGAGAGSRDVDARVDPNNADERSDTGAGTHDVDEPNGDDAGTAAHLNEADALAAAQAQVVTIFSGVQDAMDAIDRVQRALVERMQRGS